MKDNAFVYIDGFNLYNGALKDKSNYKWLDLIKLSEHILKTDIVLKVKYFTAHVKALGDNDRPIRQQIYWRALRTLYPDRIEIITGIFRVRPKKLPIAFKSGNHKNRATEQRIWVIKAEEKGSDVNLAVHLVNDASKNLFKTALIISNDTDLTEAIRIAKVEYHKKIIITNPCIWENKKPAQKLQKASSKIIKIHESYLNDCQLPENIPGTNIHKPPSWR